jgi:hypothetical protein
MRVVLFTLLSFGLAFGASAADPKTPKPIDIKKEIVEKCGSIPYGLVDLNGALASKEQMEEGKFQVTSFITQVDVYQQCLEKLEVTNANKLTPNDKRILALAAQQSQSEKEAVGAAFNDSVCEYNQAHKIADKECKNGKWNAVTSAQAKPAATAPKPAAAPKTTP